MNEYNRSIYIIVYSLIQFVLSVVFYILIYTEFYVGAVIIGAGVLICIFRIYRLSTKKINFDDEDSDYFE